MTEADPDGCAACPVSGRPENAYRNSPAYGAYELAMMKHSLELESELGVKLGGVLTWAFTFPGTPYFAGYRSLTTNGIDLPVLGAFKLLGRLSGTRLPLTSTGALALDELLTNSVRDQPEIDGIATRDGDTLQILVWNYHDDLIGVPATPLHLTVNLPANIGPSVRVSHLRVDESHGDAYTTWLAQGMPAAPSNTQVRALRSSMEPQLLVPEETVAVSAGGSVVLDFSLPRFGVSLITATPSPCWRAAHCCELIDQRRVHVSRWQHRRRRATLSATRAERRHPARQRASQARHASQTRAQGVLTILSRTTLWLATFVAV